MKRAPWPLAAAVLLVVLIATAVYWQLPRGAFVWDDLACVREQQWMLQPQAWLQLMSHPFCDMRNYFRPTAMALTMFELRTFGPEPAPLHVVSLILHLLNTLLVGSIALALRRFSQAPSAIVAGAPMLIYAIHPALVEPVAWISAQTELAVTLFMLLGLLLNARIGNPIARALAVGVCFLIAACAKESAVAFPLALLVCDWQRLRLPAQPARAVREMMRLQWPVYVAIAIGGCAYLALRQHQLGFLLDANKADGLSAIARLNQVCWLYLKFWQMLLLPFFGLGPVHAQIAGQFSNISAASLLIDAMAGAIVVFGAVAFWRRKPIGMLIAAVTVLLLPVLHIVPAVFDESLYHDRYVMAPLGLAVALLPDLASAAAPQLARLRPLMFALLGVWLLLAIFNVRTNLPLWGDEIALWQWALKLQPDSISARENLFAAYVGSNDPRTTAYAQSMIADARPCAVCMLGVARFAILTRSAPLAAAALQRLRGEEELQRDARMQYAFIVVSGDLAALNGDDAGAQAAYRLAAENISTEPLAHAHLALLLARTGEFDEASRVEATALTLLPPEERAEQEQAFKALMDAATTHR